MSTQIPYGIVLNGIFSIVAHVEQLVVVVVPVSAPFGSDPLRPAYRGCLSIVLEIATNMPDVSVLQCALGVSDHIVRLSASLIQLEVRLGLDCPDACCDGAESPRKPQAIDTKVEIAVVGKIHITVEKDGHFSRSAVLEFKQMFIAIAIVEDAE